MTDRQTDGRQYIAKVNSRSRSRSLKHLIRYALLTEEHVNKSSAVAEMSNHGHNRHGRKRGGLLSLLKGELGPCLTHTCGLGQGLHLYQVAS